MNKKTIIIIVLSIIGAILVTLGIIFTVNTINYRKTYDYKLSVVGYTEEEVANLKKLDDTSLDYLLTIPYNKNIPLVINEKYFMEKNLKKYINYFDKNSNLTDVVAIINVGADKEWYKEIKKSDVSKGSLLLVNKFYYLDDTYNSDSMMNVSVRHCYGSQKLTSDTYGAFIEMFNAAKKEDLTLIINSSYRSFKEQEEVYESIKYSKGSTYADKLAARKGHSEHQTGMAIDIQTYGSTNATFEEFDEFKWLQNNAYKYGFILRYPKNKEYLTGYEYESWHYRYVGVEVATYIHQNNITFDEYYAYFIN